MEFTFKIASTAQDFEQILELQRQNLYTLISKEDQEKQGFVFAEHTIEILQTMAIELPQIVAMHHGRVVGYNLAMTATMKEVLPSISPMFTAFETCTFNNKPLKNVRYLVGGQVCVDKDFRGHGLLSRLYRETKNQVPTDYEACVTEISLRNLRSLKAHQKMGFQVIGTYHDGIEQWNIVAWDFRGD
ncbi:GNAT family N-acetyltransferase [Pedobacter gandavensis]|uniref:GNAT family N-acetyltransferase n=1 Tax=Pedobacter gandavensis TaxID=2679963 RepID=UPI00292D984A|nr:GNAT family N-acetyltransferase [Pedobacter gandavensis]